MSTAVHLAINLHVDLIQVPTSADVGMHGLNLSAGRRLLLAVGPEQDDAGHLGPVGALLQGVNWRRVHQARRTRTPHVAG